MYTIDHLKSIIVIVVLLSTSVAVSGAQGDESRFAFISKLIETSSLAKQITDNGDPRALALRENARKLYVKAEQARDQGNRELASKRLDEAAKTMFHAIQLVRPKQLSQNKDNRDFENRRQSVDALLDAHHRISADKGIRDKVSDVEIEANKLSQQAIQLFSNGDTDAGFDNLNRAYQLVKASIESMRDGDTLVRSLAFSSKEDEYHYEIDRNDTHRMLVDMLVKDKVRTDNARQMVQKFLDKAAELRRDADQQAAKGEYAQAVRLLEDSTRDLVRAIRGAGVYIPG